MRKFTAILLGVLFIGMAAFHPAPLFVHATAFLLDYPVVRAEAHILIDADSGRVLSQQNSHRRMFPAATTMILTAILAYEHIGMDDIVIAGNEVTMLPPASARNHHEIDEAISGINLIRGMLIGAGNDTANIVALEVARRVSDNPYMEFSAAQPYFANLMTARAAALGAYNSNFMNPHGFHHDSHFSTAYDLARIARHALTIPTLAEIAASPAFSGHMAGGADYVPAGAIGFTRTWNSANELIRSASDYFFSYAAGIRTGRTNQAGDCLVAAATRGDVRLISVTLNSPEIDGAATRWRDNINLFEYGFANYAYRTFFGMEGSDAAEIGTIPIYDPTLDDDGIMSFYATDNGSYFLSSAEMDRLERRITFASHLVHDYFDEYTGEYVQKLLTPIESGDAIGTLAYYLDGEVIFSTTLYAARSAELRTTARDIDHFLARIRNTFFTASAIPFWIAGAAVVLLATVLIIVAVKAKRRNKRNFKYKWKY